MLTSQVVIDVGIPEYELLQKERNHLTITYEMQIQVEYFQKEPTRKNT